jgi:hypothetical protein
MIINSRLNGSNLVFVFFLISSPSIQSNLFCLTRITTDPDVNKRTKKKKKTNLYNKKNTEGEEQKNPLCVSDRNHWVQKKNDLSYSRSSDLRIHTGRVKKKAKRKCIKVKQINKRKKKQGHFFFAFTFYQTRSGCTT